MKMKDAPSRTPHHVLFRCVFISKKFPRLLAKREIIANALLIHKSRTAARTRTSWRCSRDKSTKFFRINKTFPSKMFGQTNKLSYFCSQKQYLSLKYYEFTFIKEETLFGFEQTSKVCRHGSCRRYEKYRKKK